MRRLICLLMCLLPILAAAEETEYRGDGQHMLTVTAETAVFARPGETELGSISPEQRIIALGEDEGGWVPVYLPEYGYGYVRDACVQPDAPVCLAYHPGYGISTALFTVDDPDSVRVEIVSMDDLEYPVVTVNRIYSQPMDGGRYAICASFATAPDVCKTTQETLCATLYDADGQPIEVLTIVFDAPLWR